MRDPKKEKTAQKELKKMLRSISNQQRSYWKLGKFACRKELADGTVVQFSISEGRAPKPSKPSKTPEKRPAKPAARARSNGAAATAN